MAWQAKLLVKSEGAFLVSQPHFSDPCPLPINLRLSPGPYPCNVTITVMRVASDVPNWHQVWFQQGTLKVAHLGSHQRIVIVTVKT